MDSKFEQLQKLAEMKKEGLLTDEEFAKMKADLLSDDNSVKEEKKEEKKEEPKYVSTAHAKSPVSGSGKKQEPLFANMDDNDRRPYKAPPEPKKNNVTCLGLISAAVFVLVISGIFGSIFDGCGSTLSTPSSYESKDDLSSLLDTSEPEFEIVGDVKISYSSGGDMIHISGKVINKSEKKANASINYKLYDSEGNVIGTASGYVFDVNGGETALFEASEFLKNEPAKYKLDSIDAYFTN